MKKIAVLLLAALSGCVVHNAPSGHPHGAPPGQVKKAVYRCHSCGTTRGSADFCHGKLMVIVD
jgi:hypothetical protein